MPAIVGPIYIMSVTDNAAASFGDVFAISPKSVAHSGCLLYTSDAADEG